MRHDWKADPFRQEVPFDVVPSRVLSAGELNTSFKSLGMKLFYDVYAMLRDDEVPNWQSDAYASVDLYLHGESVDAQDGCDRIVVSYPLATIDSCYVPRFADLLASLAIAVDGKIVHDGEAVGRDQVVAVLNRWASDLMENWGEEPGSRNLRIIIETWK